MSQKKDKKKALHEGPTARPFLEVKNVSKSFGGFVALDDVSLAVAEGEFVSILGPSGCGKTTLLRVIGGMEEHNSGHLILDGRDISRLPAARRKCSIVFQSYALFPNLTAERNVMYGMNAKGVKKGKLKKRAQELLELVGLGQAGARYPAQLSGGQQQRVALARALATEPKLLLMDEPLSALDAQVRQYLRTEIRRLQKNLGLTTIMVTHDQEEALTMADRIVVMSQGKLMQNASPEEVYRTPSDPFVAGFIGSMNFLTRWTVEQPNQLRNGNIVLRTDTPVNGSAREVTVAIRPEDIRIMSGQPHAHNVIQTQVEQIEFRGSSYRLLLRMQTDSPGADAQSLEVDLQSDLLERLGIVEQGALPVHLPPDRLLLFHDPGTDSGRTGAN